MDATAIGIIIMVVAVIVGPFAALRAVSHYRSRRTNAETGHKRAAAAEDEDKPDGFW